MLNGTYISCVILHSPIAKFLYRYTAFRQGLCKTFYDYIVEAYHSGLPINTSGGDFKTALEAQLKQGGATAPATEDKKEEKKEEKKKPVPKKPVKAPTRKPEKIKRGPVLDISFYEKETIEVKEGELK